ncbi:hypothetical protein WAI453_001683 [Rhynchosporium graminicola]
MCRRHIRPSGQDVSLCLSNIPFNVFQSVSTFFASGSSCALEVRRLARLPRNHLRVGVNTLRFCVLAIGGGSYKPAEN